MASLVALEVLGRLRPRQRPGLSRAYERRRSPAFGCPTAGESPEGIEVVLRRGGGVTGEEAGRRLAALGGLPCLFPVPAFAPVFQCLAPALGLRTGKPGFGMLGKRKLERGREGNRWTDGDDSYLVNTHFASALSPTYFLLPSAVESCQIGFAFKRRVARRVPASEMPLEGWRLGFIARFCSKVGPHDSWNTRFQVNV